MRTPPTWASPTSRTMTRSRARRWSTAPRRRASSTAARSWCTKASPRMQSRRLPHLDRRHHLLQHHAARSRRYRHDAGRGDEGRRRQHLGRRQHLQGQRHRALLPLRPARQPERCASTSRGSTSCSSTSSAAAPRCRQFLTSARLRLQDVAARRRPTRPTPTCWAPRTRPRISSSLDSGMKIVNPIMGVAFWRDDVERQGRRR